MTKIYIIGDSTVENNTPPFRGWGWALPEYLREDWLTEDRLASDTAPPAVVPDTEPPLEELPRVNDRMIFAFVLLCLLMFALFYPVLTGLRVDRDFTTALLRWFGGQYPF